MNSLALIEIRKALFQAKALCQSVKHEQSSSKSLNLSVHQSFGISIQTWNRLVLWKTLADKVFEK